MQKHFILFVIFMGIYAQAFGEKMAVMYSGAEMRSQPSAMSSKVLEQPPIFYPVEVLEKVTNTSKYKTIRKGPVTFINLY